MRRNDLRRKVVQYTVRGIPPDVDQALRKQAQERKVSLNQFLVDELTQASGVSPGGRLRSIMDLPYKWEEDPEFDKALEEQRQIDWEKWR